MTLRGSVIYTAAVMALVALIDLSFAIWALAPATLQDVMTRLALLAIFRAGTAILRRRLLLQQAAERSVHAAAERLEELDRLRADFVATVSHDLRTPLTAVRAGLGLLATSAHDRLLQDEQRLLLNGQRNVERLSRLIDDLLAYNQLEAGTLHLQCDRIDLRSVVLDAAAAAVQPLIGEKQQQLDANLPERLPCAGDARRLEQVLVNLLANAHDHTPAGTHITVAAQRTQAGICVSVGDNGPGIPPKNGNYFERFQRRSAADGGSGLGLTIVRRTVTMHGGWVWVETTLGRGACFYVVLPCADNQLRGATP